MAEPEQQERAAGVSRQMNDEAPPKEKEQGSPEASETAAGADAAGESTNRRGEDVSADDGQEAGRTDTGPQGATQRPSGTSDGRDSTGVDPQDSTTGGPTLPAP